MGLLPTALVVFACSGPAEPSGSGGGAASAGQRGGGASGQGSGGAVAVDASASKDATGDLSTSDLPASDAGKTDADAGGKTDAAEFWTTPFVANCSPPLLGGRSQSDGHHRAGEDCMQSGCHAGGSPDAGAPFLFGGTVRRAGSLALYPSVEVAVKTPSGLYAACSAANGNFWVVAANVGALDWSTASARVRTSNGETVMLPPPEAGCSTCHSEVLLLTAP